MRIETEQEEKNNWETNTNTERNGTKKKTILVNGRDGRREKSVGWWVSETNAHTAYECKWDRDRNGWQQNKMKTIWKMLELCVCFCFVLSGFLLFKYWNFRNQRHSPLKFQLKNNTENKNNFRFQSASSYSSLSSFFHIFTHSRTHKFLLTFYSLVVPFFQFLRRVFLIVFPFLMRFYCAYAQPHAWFIVVGRAFIFICSFPLSVCEVWHIAFLFGFFKRKKLVSIQFVCMSVILSWRSHSTQVICKANPSCQLLCVWLLFVCWLVNCFFVPLFIYQVTIHFVYDVH